MSPWPTGDHCAAWIGLAPKNEVSGGKILKKRTRKVVSRLATALRMAATTLRLSQSYLGAQFRRFRGKLGAPKAITAWLPRAIETALEFKMSSGGGAAGSGDGELVTTRLRVPTLAGRIVDCRVLN